MSSLACKGDDLKEAPAFSFFRLCVRIDRAFSVLFFGRHRWERSFRSRSLLELNAQLSPVDFCSTVAADAGSDLARGSSFLIWYEFLNNPGRFARTSAKSVMNPSLRYWILIF